jgi:ketosteroid isomerase-like protein
VPEHKLETARRAAEGFNERGMLAVADYSSPDVVWHTDPRVPEPGVYEGKEAVLAYLSGWVNAFGAFTVDIHDIRDAGGDDVALVITAHARPLGDPTADTQLLRWTLIETIRDGQIVKIRSIMGSQDEATESADPATPESSGQA